MLVWMVFKSGSPPAKLGSVRAEYALSDILDRARSHGHINMAHALRFDSQGDISFWLFDDEATMDAFVSRNSILFDRVTHTVRNYAP